MTMTTKVVLFVIHIVILCETVHGIAVSDSDDVIIMINDNDLGQFDGEKSDERGGYKVYDLDPFQHQQKQQLQQHANHNTRALPNDPMVIKLLPFYAPPIPRVEYKGCHKFCVGSISSQPSEEKYDSEPAWDPYNQTCDQLYYFRYVDVNMTECRWPRSRKGHGPSIVELFFDTENMEDPSQYSLSLPTMVRESKFKFLIHHPDADTGDIWTVRWTGYMNTCNVNQTLPIKPHYEPDAFHPKDYVHFQDGE